MAKTLRKDQSAQSKKKFALQLTRKGVGLLVCLIVLISAWTFTLGVLVGRDTAPVKFDIKKLEKRLAALKASDLKEKLKRFKISFNDGEEKRPELGFHEALKTTKSDIQLPAPIPKTLPKAAAATPEKSEEKKKIAKKTETPKTEPKPEPTESQKRFTVQVASTKDLKGADRMVSRLKTKGYPAYKVLGKVPGKGIWIRIRVGPYKNKNEAEKALAKLKKNKLKGFILNYN
jgi:cell division protein FtsN